MEIERDLFESWMCDENYEPDWEELEVMREREQEDAERVVRGYAEAEITWAEEQHGVVLPIDQRLAAIDSVSANADVDPDVDFDEDGFCGAHYYVTLKNNPMQIVALGARLHIGNAVRVPHFVAPKCHRPRAKRPPGTRRRRAVRRTSGCRSPGRSTDDGPEPPLASVNAALRSCVPVGGGCR